MSFEETVERFGLEAFETTKEKFGEKWALLSVAEKDAAKRAARRLIQLNLKKKQLQATGESAATIATVIEDIEFVTVTVGEFQVAAEIAATSAFQDAFWEGVNKALEALGSFLAGAGKSLIPGLGEFLDG